jgi:hypothetical protein
MYCTEHSNYLFLSLYTAAQSGIQITDEVIFFQRGGGGEIPLAAGLNFSERDVCKRNKSIPYYFKPAPPI